MNAALPLRFQVRAEIQALVNALRRPTSDRLKLVRLADAAMRTLTGAGMGTGELGTHLAIVQQSLAVERPFDRHEAAASLDRAATAIDWSGRGAPARRPAEALRPRRDEVLA